MGSDNKPMKENVGFARRPNTPEGWPELDLARFYFRRGVRDAKAVGSDKPQKPPNGEAGRPPGASGGVRR